MGALLGSAGWNLDSLGAGDTSALGVFTLPKSLPQKPSLQVGGKSSFWGGFSSCSEQDHPGVRRVSLGCP